MTDEIGNETDVIDRFDAPRMHYCIDTMGTYDGLFNGEDILLSAGLAWNNPGSGFSLHAPDSPNRVIVESGGFQATTGWDLTYAYSIRDLFEWGVEVGADEVALPDFACEPELHESTPRKRVDLTVSKHREAMNVYRGESWPFDVLPVLQGWDPDEYRRCARLFQRHDIVSDRMAIGTVCKRDDPSMIGAVLDACEDVLGRREWHLFGMTLNGWKDSRLWGRFASSDTSAWNWGAESKADKKRLFREYREKVGQYGLAIEEQSRLVTSTDGGNARSVDVNEITVGTVVEYDDWQWALVTELALSRDKPKLGFVLLDEVGDHIVQQLETANGCRQHYEAVEHLCGGEHEYWAPVEYVVEDDIWSVLGPVHSDFRTTEDDEEEIVTDGGTETDGTEHTQCVVCGYEPDPDRVPPHYVLSLSDEGIDDEYVQSYPFGGSLSVPFACSDECWLDAQDDPELVADGGTERPDPTEDPAACSKCGVHIGLGGDEYCDRCAREIGTKPPLERCMHCGQRAPQEQMESVDISTEDEYYPTIRYLCRGCSGGESA